MTQEFRTKKADSDVEIVECKTVFQGYFRIDAYKLKFKLFEGGWSNVMSRELFERGQVAAVLPYDPVLKQVVLIEQFRVGAMADERSPWLLEAVAGILEPGETHEALIHREADEEAGIEIHELEAITHYWVSPGGCSERVALYCGKVDATQAFGIHGVDHEHEDIKVHVFDIEEAFELVRNGIVNNAPGIIGLQWLELNYKSLWK